jgi:hypothetical protein
MLTTVALLAGLLTASDAPAQAPATPVAQWRVEAGYGVRIAVPPLGPAGPVEKLTERQMQQVFAFYVGFAR